MRSLKIAGVVACGLALSVTTATAAPQVLDDAALDGVVAGFDLPGLSSETVSGLFPRPSFGLGLFPSLFPSPEIVIRLEGSTDSNSTAGTGDGGAVSAQSVTTGGPAELARQNPEQFLPLVRVFPFPNLFPTSR